MRGKLDAASLLGRGIIIADDGQFLGAISDDRYEASSIANKYGEYGSRYSTTSIWNRYGEYGSKYGALSPFNSYTTTPPRVFVNRQFVGYLSANRLLDAAVIHPAEIAIATGREDALER